MPLPMAAARRSARAAEMQAAEGAVAQELHLEFTFKNRGQVEARNLRYSEAASLSNEKPQRTIVCSK